MGTNSQPSKPAKTRNRSSNKVQPAKPKKGAGRFEKADEVTMTARVEDNELAGIRYPRLDSFTDPAEYWLCVQRYGQLIFDLGETEYERWLADDKRVETLKAERAAILERKRVESAVENPAVRSALLDQIAEGKAELSADQAMAMLASLQAMLEGKQDDS